MDLKLHFLMRVLFASFVLLIVSSLSLSLPETSEPALTAESIAAIFSIPGPEAHIAAANKNFTTKFYASISKDDGNIFFSPLGIHTVLSMLYQGADGTTKEALETALEVSEPSEVAEGYSHIITNLNQIKSVTLHSANKAYLQKGYNLLKDYDTVMKEKFQTQVESLNFSENELAAKAINTWVSNSTNGKIPTLFGAEDFDALTRLVLINAIYFKGDWKTKFDKSDTRTENFFVDQNNKTDVQMMHATGEFYYKRESQLEAQVIEMPFTGNEVSMFIVLPFDRSGIGKLEDRIQELGMDIVFTDLYPGDARVALPKFKIETKIDLTEPLKEMGLEELFGGSCNLTKMVDSEEDLYVSRAMQKAYIEVNEEGAEAAAVSGVSLQIRFGHLLYYENFYADHPFLVIIKQGNNILFYGRIVKPISGDSEVAPRLEPVTEIRPIQHNAAS